MYSGNNNFLTTALREKLYMGNEVYFSKVHLVYKVICNGPDKKQTLPDNVLTMVGTAIVIKHLTSRDSDLSAPLAPL